MTEKSVWNADAIRAWVQASWTSWRNQVIAFTECQSTRCKPCMFQAPAFCICRHRGPLESIYVPSHKQLGGIDNSNDYTNVRPTKKGKNIKKSLNLRISSCLDFDGDQIFKCALDRFLSRIMWTACAHLLEPTDLGST